MSRGWLRRRNGYTGIKLTFGWSEAFIKAFLVIRTLGILPARNDIANILSKSNGNINNIYIIIK